ncbi:pteridine reductase [Candidatus Tenderia electrophaga]|jgi:pteridine reductase|uniref:Pteridine reductase n=1 Tax=Candidatus Tenderia electrophaga TaxID=1748243 RepID=A0A0S2TGQ6_9GAMM|nr:pteridine reductase [Candidatus Tenderia electrophaga]
MNDPAKLDNKVALITGAAHRIGAELARRLHGAGMNIALHYRHSSAQAEALAAQLNAIRPDSVVPLQADLLDTARLPAVIAAACQPWQRLDVLINNASTFYPTPMDSASEADWDDLIGSNLKAPFFLSQAAAPELKKRQGCIINIVDIHAQRPMKDYPIYSAAKAGLAMLTMALARELGPELRVNGVAPGAILWPERALKPKTKEQIINRTALKRQGAPADIAKTVLFLIRDADYISGQIINVDGGRTLGF